MASSILQNDELTTDALNSIGNLELLSTRVVDGILSGKHRSTFLGGSFEFANHRAYAPGDEIRMIDWKVYARRDRYYIRQFEETTSLQGLMVIDCSGSMDFGISTPSKLNYARAACACLSRLMLRQRDGVGLALVGRKLETYLPPRGYPRHLQTILQVLRSVTPQGETRLGPSLFELPRRLKRRGMLILFSDCLGDWAKTAEALKHARLRGHEVLVFQVMAPEELTFQFSQWSRFECLERKNDRIDLDPPAIRELYLQNLNQFLEQVEKDCTNIGADHLLFSTDENLGDALSYYLNRRASRMKH
ncbi:MAG: DUF58 domain-containing protein [Planctomycetaceae bacterium]|nr:DUF58 domain-containing protein [Planctomycetaceae bacterium]